MKFTSYLQSGKQLNEWFNTLNRGHRSRIERSIKPNPKWNCSTLKWHDWEKFKYWSVGGEIDFEIPHIDFVEECDKSELEYTV